MPIISTSLFITALFGAAVTLAPEKEVTTQSGVPVAILDFESASLPPLTKLKRSLPHAEMTGRVKYMLEKRTCIMRGQRPDHFDISVPFAVLLGTDGVVKKLVISDTGCKPLELLTAEVVVSQAGRGDFRVNEGLKEQWFGSDVYYQVGRSKVGTVASNPDKVSCRSRPRLGSRIQTDKTCKTASNWAEYDRALKQLRKDMQDAEGVCRGDC